MGLCGSALIDLAAGLLRHRILTPQGKLCTPDELPGDVPPELRRRVVAYDGQVSFLLVPESESGTGKPDDDRWTVVRPAGRRHVPKRGRWAAAKPGERLTIPAI